MPSFIDVAAAMNSDPNGKKETRVNRNDWSEGMKKVQRSHTLATQHGLRDFGRFAPPNPPSRRPRKQIGNRRAHSPSICRKLVTLYSDGISTVFKWLYSSIVQWLIQSRLNFILKVFPTGEEGRSSSHSARKCFLPPCPSPPRKKTLLCSICFR